MTSRNNGLYIHFPFCKTRCNYCAFYSQTNNHNHEQYVSALLKDAQKNRDFFHSDILNTIYMGGGTPSLLPTDIIDMLLKKLACIFDVSQCKEITIEVNPDDIDEDYISSLKALVINRLSVGIQSLNDNELKTLNRRHDATKAIKSLEIIAKHFDNFSVDIMYGLPGQTIESLHKTLDGVLKYHPTHISAYALSLEPGTALCDMSGKGLIETKDEDFVVNCYNVVNEILEQRNYVHYEVSNYCLPGFEAQHNSNYWNGSKYLGLGAAAHSYNGETRKWNVASVGDYINCIDKNERYYDFETLDDVMKYNEYVMLGLRTNKGIDFQYIKDFFGEEFYHTALHGIEGVNELFILYNSDKFILNDAGLFVADGIAEALWHNGEGA